jgi:hypothetical protein
VSSSVPRGRVKIWICWRANLPWETQKDSHTHPKDWDSSTLCDMTCGHSLELSALCPLPVIPFSERSDKAHFRQSLVTWGRQEMMVVHAFKAVCMWLMERQFAAHKPVICQGPGTWRPRAPSEPSDAFFFCQLRNHFLQNVTVKVLFNSIKTSCFKGKQVNK